MLEPLPPGQPSDSFAQTKPGTDLSHDHLGVYQMFCFSGKGRRWVLWSALILQTEILWDPNSLISGVQEAQRVPVERTAATQGQRRGPLSKHMVYI